MNGGQFPSTEVEYIEVDLSTSSLNAEQEQIARDVMQPDYTFERGGCGSKGRRVKQDKPLTIADRIEKQRRRLSDAGETGYRNAHVQGKVTPHAKKLLLSDPAIKPGKLLEEFAKVVEACGTVEKALELMRCIARDDVVS